MLVIDGKAIITKYYDFSASATDINIKFDMLCSQR